jgi:hypothetical protein
MKKKQPTNGPRENKYRLFFFLLSVTFQINDDWNGNMYV